MDTSTLTSVLGKASFLDAPVNAAHPDGVTWGVVLVISMLIVLFLVLRK